MYSVLSLERRVAGVVKDRQRWNFVGPSLRKQASMQTHNTVNVLWKGCKPLLKHVKKKTRMSGKTAKNDIGEVCESKCESTGSIRVQLSFERRGKNKTIAESQVISSFDLFWNERVEPDLTPLEPGNRKERLRPDSAVVLKLLRAKPKAAVEGSMGLLMASEKPPLCKR